MDPGLAATYMCWCFHPAHVGRGVTEGDASVVLCALPACLPAGTAPKSVVACIDNQTPFEMLLTGA